jgi:hypothetical protein
MTVEQQQEYFLKLIEAFSKLLFSIDKSSRENARNELKALEIEYKKTKQTDNQHP